MFTWQHSEHPGSKAAHDCIGQPKSLHVLPCLQTAMKHVSDYYMFYESGLVPWVHYVPFGEYDKDDVLPVCILARASSCIALPCLSIGQDLVTTE